MPMVTSADGTSIGYETHGTGPTLILVSGATQYRAVDEASPKLAALLADAFAVVLYDRRGRGESGNATPYAVKREIEDIAALIDAARAPAILAGSSSGAVLAVEAAAALPEKISALICYEPPINIDQTREESDAALRKQEQFAAKGDGEAAMIAFMSDVGMPPEALRGFRASPAWPAFTAVGHTIAHDFRILAEANGNGPPARWQKAKMPALVLNGDRSFAFMASGADWVASGLPDARRKVLKGQDHGPAPEIFSAAIREFLAR